MEKNQEEYIKTLLKIINEDLPVIQNYNIHLYYNIRSAIELVLDQASQYIENMREKAEITEETIKDVDNIIAEIQGD